MSHLGIGQAMYGRRWSAQDRAVFMQTVDNNSSAKEGGGEGYKRSLEEARSSVEKGSVLTNPRDGSEFSSASEYRLCQTRHVRMFKDPIEKYTQSVKPRTTSQEYYCYYCRYMRFGCNFCPEQFNAGSQRNTLYALEYYTNYYSDYYAQFFTGNPHPRP